MTTTTGTAGRPSGRGAMLIAVLLILFGVLNHSGSLGWGFVYDDFLHQLALQFGGIGSGWSLYDFAPTGDAAASLPWWTSDDFQVRYLRPFSTFTIVLDRTLYGDWAVGYHISSLLYFALFLVLAYRLYIALGAGTVAALWALAILALDDGHVLPVGWIANRPSLLAGLLMIGTLLLVHRYCERQRIVTLLAAVGAFLMACMAKETGIMSVAIIGVYLWTMRRASDETPVQGLFRTLRTPVLWLFVALAGAYAVGYVLAGYGTTSAMHASPTGDPLTFVARIASGMTMGLGGLSFGVPTDLVFARPELKQVLLPISVVLVAILVIAAWVWARPRPLAIFAAGWALAALIPASVVPTSDRALTIASVGTALLIGLILNGLGSPRALWSGRRIPALALWCALIAAGILISVPFLHVRSMLFARMATADYQALVSADYPPPESRPATVVLLDSPSSMLPLFAHAVWAITHSDPSQVAYPLQLGRRALTLERIDEQTLKLDYAPPGLLTARFEPLFLTSSAPPEPGRIYVRPDFTVRVLESSEVGILSASFEFERSVDDPRYWFLAWQGERFQRIAMPTPGNRLELPAVEPMVPYAP